MLAEYVEPFNDALTAVSLALPRIMVCFLLIPVLSNRFLHGILRTAVSVGLGIPVAVGIYYQTQIIDINVMSIVGLFLKEAVLGLLIGFLLALPFWLFESIGTVFDTQRGSMMGEQLNPETGTMTSITGLLLLQSAIVLMIELGAFAWMFGVIMHSYVLWPALEWIPAFSGEASQLVVSEFSTMAMRFVLYALPLLISLLIIELIFALVSLYAPQLQVYFLAMPVKSMCGMLILAVMAGLLWEYGAEEFARMKEGENLLEGILPAYLSNGGP